MSELSDIEKLVIKCKYREYTAERGDKATFQTDEEKDGVFITVKEGGSMKCVKINREDIASVIIWLASVLDAQPEQEDEDSE